MFKFIEGLPADVLAIEASGKVTHEDYRDTLIPKAEAMMAKGSIKMLCVIGRDFTGFEIEAFWDDGAFGLKHRHDFSRIAVVTDHAWMSATVNMFKPFFTGKSGCSGSPHCLPRKTGSRALPKEHDREDRYRAERETSCIATKERTRIMASNGVRSQAAVSRPGSKPVRVLKSLWMPDFQAKLGSSPDGLTQAETEADPIWPQRNRREEDE